MPTQMSDAEVSPKPPPAAASVTEPEGILRRVVLPASGFVLLLAVVWLINYQLRAQTAPTSNPPVPPPVSKPEGVLAELVVPQGARTWAALRPFAGVAGLPLPRAFGPLIVSVFGLPPQSAALVLEERPVAAAFGRDSHGPYWVVGAHVESGEALLEELRSFKTPHYWIDVRPDRGLTLIMPRPGVTDRRFTLALSGNVLLAAREDEHLLALAPYVARNLAQRQDVDALLHAELDPAALSKLGLDSLGEFAQIAAWGRDVVRRSERITLEVHVQDQELSAVLHLAGSSFSALPMSRPNALLELPASTVGLYVHDAARLLDMPQLATASEELAQLGEARKLISSSLASGFACASSEGHGLGVLCRGPLSKAQDAERGLLNATRFVSDDRRQKALLDAWGLRMVDASTDTLRGVRAYVDPTVGAAFEAFWSIRDNELTIAASQAKAAALLEAESPPWRTRKTALRWLEEAPVAFVVLAQPARLGTPQGPSNPEALLGMMVRGQAGQLRVQLRAEAEALAPLVAQLWL